MKQLPFTSPDIIIAWIDKYQRDIPKLQQRIADNAVLADKLRETKESFRVPEIRRDCQLIEKRIEWRLARLRKLGELLAEVKTLSLPHMENTHAPAPNVDANPF